jgi:steroid delta-isomerase-like uncharacterized protein
MTAIETRAPSDIAKTIFERLNHRDLEGTAEFACEDVDEYWPVVGRLQGVAAVRAHFAAIFAAMPDFKIDVERMAADGETVFVHWHMTGHFTGAPFYGLAATGREIDLRGTDCFTIHDGKVTSNFIAYDGMSFAVQAGILPASGSRMDHLITHLTNLRTRAMRLLHH